MGGDRERGREKRERDSERGREKTQREEREREEREGVEREREREREKTAVSFLCVVKTHIRWSNKIYKTELTKTRYNNQVLGKYRVDPQRARLTLRAELTRSNLGLKEV